MALPAPGGHGSVSSEKSGLDKKRPERMLEGGDGTVGVGKGGLEVCEDLGGGSLGCLCRQVRRRAAAKERRADLALAQVEASPDALPGAVAALTIAAADGVEDAVGGGALKELPQRGGGEAEASDLVGEPDAERAAAAKACVAVAAKDAAGAEYLSLGVALVKTVQEAVPDQGADTVAMRTGRVLEAFGNGVPFGVIPRKPTRLGHGRLPRKKRHFTGAARGGVAGYDGSSLSGVRGSGVSQIRRVRNVCRSDDNSATSDWKCDQSGGKDSCGISWRWFGAEAVEPG